MNSNPTITDFSGGLLNPTLAGKFDAEFFGKGCQQLQNFLVLPGGGITRRPGTKFVQEVDEKPRFVPFVFADDQAYCLEFTTNVIRFYVNGAPVLGPEGSTDLATNGSFGSGGGWTMGSAVTISGGLMHVSAADGYRSGTQSMVISAGESYYLRCSIVAGAGLSGGSQGSQFRAVIGSTAGEDWAVTGDIYEAVIRSPENSGEVGLQFDPDFIGRIDNLTVYPAGVYQVSTPFIAGDLADIKFGQVTDKLHLTCNRVSITTLTRLAHANWTLSAESIANAPSQWTSTDNPVAITFFEQRSVLIGGRGKPQTVVFSKSGDFWDFDTAGATWEKGLEVTPAAGDVNPFHWGEFFRNVIILGCSGSAWSVSSNNTSEPLGPESVRYDKAFAPGFCKTQGRVVGHGLIGIDQHRHKLLDTLWSNEAGGFVPTNVLKRALHLGEKRLMVFAYQDEPWSAIWVVREDGQIICLNIDRLDQLYAWSEQTTEGEFEEVLSIPGQDGDDLYLATKRTLGDGTEKHYVEFLAPKMKRDTPVREGVFVDCSLTYHNPVVLDWVHQTNPCRIDSENHNLSTGDVVRFSGIGGGPSGLNDSTFVVSASNSNAFYVNYDATGGQSWDVAGDCEQSVLQINGLDHLEGLTVDICGDGADYGQEVVTSGSITLDDRVCMAHIGLRQEAVVEPMDLQLAAQGGYGVGRHSRVWKAYARFDRTVGGWIGPDEDHLEELQFRDVDDQAGEAIPPKTGYRGVYQASWYKRRHSILVKQIAPLPMTITSIVVEGETGKL